MVFRLGLFRTLTLGLSFLFAIIVLGASAAAIAWTSKHFFAGGYYTFSALGVATSLLTIFTLPVMLILDIVRNGPFTSMVVVELVWLSFLWVLWLATAADAANAISAVGFGANCSQYLFSSLCTEFNLVAAFAFLIWLLLLAYTATLLAHAIVGARRGHPAWTASVRHGAFLGPAAGAGKKAGQPEAQGVGQPAQGAYASTTYAPGNQYPPTHAQV